MKPTFSWIVFCLFFFQGTNVLLFFCYPIIYSNSVIYPGLLLILFCFLKKGLGSISFHSIERKCLIISLLLALIQILIKGSLYTVNFLSVFIIPFLFTILLREEEVHGNIVKTRKILLSFFVINCTIAIIERLTTHVFFPSISNDISLDFTDTEGFRSIALTGHPLTGAFFTLVSTTFILLSKNRYKCIYVILGIIALFCFNSRAAILSMTIVLGAFFVRLFFDKRSNLLTRLSIIVILFISCFIVIFLINNNFGDRLLEFGSDNSSSVRFDNLLYIEKTDLETLLIGLNQREIVLATDKFGGYTSIIENPWILYIMRYGLVIMATLIISYIYLFKSIVYGYKFSTIMIIIIPWLICQSSNNGFAASCDDSIVKLIYMFFAFRPNIIDNKL